MLLEDDGSVQLWGISTRLEELDIVKKSLRIS